MRLLNILLVATCASALVIDLNPSKLTQEQEKALAAITVQEDPKPKPEPTKEEPKPKEEPKKDEPKKDEPKKDEPKKDEPKKEDPKPEPPKNEPPKQEPPKSNLSGDQQKALDAHNAARAEVKDGQKRDPMQWDKGLEDAARKWAKHLADRNQGLEHAQDRDGKGENLAGRIMEGDAMEKASKMWIDEKKDYKCGVKIQTYIDNGNFGKIGHYTQVIWPKTTKVGIAVEGGFVVARYSEAGNMMSEAACKA
ncbi:hypothetical protein MCOR25_009212 [Pyricularia grisea]|uniref:SCP domain-containing protein n=1 Tax=Pyricularia grisea TaxID=148305 RepID=A0A6P8B1I6_PYRGI|nr:uncharacterized protein PgNI_07159 [Pyricularia grisea]KAI6353009.1 hypothetical protein MCOR25_009212 [Pyricularia grisea]TLD08717.1 hypothetical protein PgNI_07159 [Pyricularia grisea]